MKRSPLTRKTALPARNTRITPKKRTASEFARIYGSKERVEWMKRQPCVALSHPEHVCFGEIENAHTESGGVGRKADADTIVPLCVGAHRLVHAIGQRSFEIQFSVDLKASAASYRARWLAEGER